MRGGNTGNEEGLRGWQKKEMGRGHVGIGSEERNYGASGLGLSGR